MLQTLWELFATFFMIGCVSFGGGYAMLSLIEREVTAHGWMTVQELTDTVAVAGMSPGPIATNSAILIGYKTAAVPGAIVSALGMILPSFLIVTVVAAFLYKIHRHKLVQAAFYGLRPIITGLIVYAAFRFAVGNGVLGSPDAQSLAALAICVAALFALLRFRAHPALVIVAAGVVGVAVYG